MIDFFEGCVAGLILFLIVLIVFLLNSDYEKGVIKDALYAECLTTEYDKFQCYSMIHGDK